MSGELDELARVAADALVSAMVTDSWEAVRRRFVSVVRQERRMDETRAKLAAVNAADRDEALKAEVLAWTTRLRDLLQDDPAAAGALRGLVADLGAQRPAAAPVMQQTHADRGSSAVTVGPISGSNVNVISGPADQRKRETNVFLMMPFVTLTHVTRKLITTHPAISTAVITVVLGTGAVAGFRMHQSSPPGQPQRHTAPGSSPAVTRGGSPQPSPSTSGPSGGSRTTEGEAAPEWGFALDRWVTDPVGTTHELWAAPPHDSNEEADWTYGPWRFGQPNPIPVARASHLATGRYRVVLPGVGTPGGIAQVSVYDYTAAGAFCQPARWRQQGADEAIDVACFDRSGQPADVPFAALFLAGNRGRRSLGGARGFVYAASPAALSYTPGPSSESNAGAVTRTGTGRYTVALAGGAEVAQVSAVGSRARHCALSGLTATTAAVTCTTASSTPADTAFTLSYTGQQSLLDDRSVPQAAFINVSDAPGAAAPSLAGWWLSKPGAPTITRTGTGRYTLKMPMGYLPSYTHLTPRGSGYCTVVLRNDYSFKDNAIFYVACFTSSGTPANNGFDLTYMTASPYD